MVDASIGRVVLRMMVRAWVISSEEVVKGPSRGLAEGSRSEGAVVGIRGSNVEMRVSVVCSGKSGCQLSICHAHMISHYF
jgi:hypothetical protein